MNRVAATCPDHGTIELDVDDVVITTVGIACFCPHEHLVEIVIRSPHAIGALKACGARMIHEAIRD